jgi:hypothetical protein
MSTFRLNEEPTNKINTPVSGEQAQTQNAEETNTANEGKIKEIILKGPLGHAYTEALNLLLDKKTNPDRDIRQESVYQSLVAIILQDEAESDPNVSGDLKAYVYVYDGKKMGMGELSEMFEEISSKKEAIPEGGYVCAVVENSESLLDQPHLSQPFEKTILALENRKINFFFSKSGAINGVIGFLKS